MKIIYIFKSNLLGAYNRERSGFRAKRMIVLDAERLKASFSKDETNSVVLDTKCYEIFRFWNGIRGITLKTHLQFLSQPKWIFWL